MLNVPSLYYVLYLCAEVYEYKLSRWEAKIHLDLSFWNRGEAHINCAIDAWEHCKKYEEYSKVTVWTNAQCHRLCTSFAPCLWCIWISLASCRPSGINLTSCLDRHSVVVTLIKIPCNTFVQSISNRLDSNRTHASCPKNDLTLRNPISIQLSRLFTVWIGLWHHWHFGY